VHRPFLSYHWSGRYSLDVALICDYSCRTVWHKPFISFYARRRAVSLPFGSFSCPSGRRHGWRRTACGCWNERGAFERAGYPTATYAPVTGWGILQRRITPSLWRRWFGFAGQRLLARLRRYPPGQTPECCAGWLFWGGREDDCKLFLIPGTTTRRGGTFICPPHRKN
jgi:hypothetical protein